MLNVLRKATDVFILFAFILYVQEVAYSLRNLILNAPRKPLPTKLRPKDIKTGEVDALELLILFFNCLLSGNLLLTIPMKTEFSY